MERDQSFASDPELDRLLGQAKWPEPRPEEIRRLRGYWQTARRRRARRLYAVCAVAATLLMTVGIRAWRSPQESPKAIATHAAFEPSTGHSATVASESPSVSAGDLFAARDPNLYERVVMMGAPRERVAKSRTATKRPPIERTIDELIAILITDPSDDITDWLPVGERDLARCERMLWGIIESASDDRRLAATRVLVQLATPRSMPILMGLANDLATHDVAVLGLARLVSTAELARLASIDPDAKLRQILLGKLLERRTLEAVGLYLSFVDSQDSRALALAAIANMADPPVDYLLSFIESPQRSLRLAAARTLAQLPGPEVARRLSELALDGVGRQEALIALLLSHNSQANNFLNHARRDLYLVASVHAAEQQLLSLGNPSGGNLP